MASRGDSGGAGGGTSYEWSSAIRSQLRRREKCGRGRRDQPLDSMAKLDTELELRGPFGATRILVHQFEPGWCLCSPSFEHSVGTYLVS